MMFTILPYGSDNYFSSDKEAGRLDRASCRTTRRFPGTVHSPAFGRGKGGRPAREKVHASGGDRARRRPRRLYPQRLLQKMTGIADTGFLVAFARNQDRYHRWAVRVAEQV